MHGTGMDGLGCASCQARMKKLFALLGFSQGITGGWERVSPRGKVMLDLKPMHHTRTALLALCVWLIQGKTS